MGMTPGQIIGSIVGAVAGYFIPGVGFALGMAIGGMIGGWIDPPAAEAPPPLGDLGINSFVNNAPVSLAYGQTKLYGGCIWLGTVSADNINFGDRKNPRYNVVMDIEFAIAHCEGTTGSILKRWVNDKTIEEIAADENLNMTFVFREYPGSNTQTVDPTIQAFLVGSDAPACPFRYTAYSFVHITVTGSLLGTIPNYSVELKALLTETDEEDANPIRCAYDFMTNIRYGCEIPTSMFDGDPDTPGTSWYDAAAYCDELVTFTNGDIGQDETAPRFRFSGSFDTRTKGYDIVKIIMQSCRGIISWTQGKLYCKIENESEPITNYFSDENIVNYTSTGSSTVDRIYFSSSIVEPEGYWEGASLSFVIDGKTYNEMIHIQSTDYVDLVDSLETAPLNGTEIKLVKDNIKEGSFNYNKASSRGQYNSIRVEFINRKWFNTETNLIENEYQWDVVEHDCPEAYLNESYGSPTVYYSQQQIRLSGVQRKVQAMLMAKWFADVATYLKYQCVFSTDIVGYFHKVGDIICVSHSIIGWVNKEFRITQLEEIDNDEVKLTCLEYNRGIYGDDIPPVFTSTTSVTQSIYKIPDDIERLYVLQDDTDNKVYLLFKRPDANNFWVGGQVFVKVGPSGEYRYYTTIAMTTASVTVEAVTAVQTQIEFYPDSIYGAFPDSGEFWIEDELISYSSIYEDDTDPENIHYYFNGCTRGTGAVLHSSTYANLKTDQTPYVEFDDADIGLTYYFKILSTNSVGITSDITTADEVSITIS